MDKPNTDKPVHLKFKGGQLNFRLAFLFDVVDDNMHELKTCSKQNLVGIADSFLGFVVLQGSKYYCYTNSSN